MQYASAAVLLHRPLANFGTSGPQHAHGPASKLSRDICVHHACLIAQYIQQYQDMHGSVLTMSWIALHIIATAATTLIASLSGSSATSAKSTAVIRELTCLQTCIKALGELELSHLATRRVRRVIQQAMRILDLDVKVRDAGHNGDFPEAVAAISTGSSGPTLEQGHGGGNYDVSGVGSVAAEDDMALQEAGTCEVPFGGGTMLMADLYTDGLESWDFSEQFLPSGSHTDMLRSFASFME